MASRPVEASAIAVAAARRRDRDLRSRLRSVFRSVFPKCVLPMYRNVHGTGGGRGARFLAGMWQGSFVDFAEWSHYRG
jgi:hypothetical protein